MLNKIKIFEMKNYGTVLECFDVETADQFDDFLAQNLDHKISLQFKENSVLFFFGKEISQASVQALYSQFQKENNIT